jgi:hypothetical protein
LHEFVVDFDGINAYRFAAGDSVSGDGAVRYAAADRALIHR